MKSQLVPPRLKPLVAAPLRDDGRARRRHVENRLPHRARSRPASRSAPNDWRTHRIRVLGIGHQRSLGVKHGLVVDMDEAERAIRQTVDAAERMAGIQIDRVIVTASGGRLASEHFTAKRAIGGREVAETDIHRVLEASAAHHLHRGRVAVHSLPTGFSLDGVSGIREPKDMIGDELGVDLHVATCDQAAARNLMLAVERAPSRRRGRGGGALRRGAVRARARRSRNGRHRRRHGRRLDLARRLRAAARWFISTP